jgi:hypothetical protein
MTRLLIMENIYDYTSTLREEFLNPHLTITPHDFYITKMSPYCYKHFFLTYFIS